MNKLSFLFPLVVALSACGGGSGMSNSGGNAEDVVDTAGNAGDTTNTAGGTGNVTDTTGSTADNSGSTSGTTVDSGGTTVDSGGSTSGNTADSGGSTSGGTADSGGSTSGSTAGSGGSTSGSTVYGGSGKVSLGVTDAPVDEADAVVVTFTQVELVNSDGSVETVTVDPAATIDLLAQQGGDSAPLISGEVLPAGVYTDIRLLIDSAPASCNNLSAPFSSYITIDGTDYPLTVPSGSQSGLKVKGPLTIAAGGSVSYTIDFDLRKSISERGKKGCYNLRPVLRLVDNAEVGTLTGSVDAALLQQDQCTSDPVTGAGAAVYLFANEGAPDDLDGDDGDALTTANLVAGDTGFTYTVGFLPAGTYTAAFTCQAASDSAEADDTIAFQGTASVTITADETTTQNFTLEVTPTGATGGSGS